MCTLGESFTRTLTVRPDQELVAELGPARAACRERTAKLVPGLY